MSTPFGLDHVAFVRLYKDSVRRHMETFFKEEISAEWGIKDMVRATDGDWLIEMYRRSDWEKQKRSEGKLK